jgi:hypothetical protein
MAARASSIARQYSRSDLFAWDNHLLLRFGGVLAAFPVFRPR